MVSKLKEPFQILYVLKLKILSHYLIHSNSAQIHAIVTHFTRSHALVEPFAVAMYRCLPAQHPVYKLLLPHLNGVIPIDVQVSRDWCHNLSLYFDNVVCV